MNSETKIQTPKILRNPRSKEDRRKPELSSCEETSVGRRRFLCCASLFQLVSNSIHTVICWGFFCFCFFLKQIVLVQYFVVFESQDIQTYRTVLLLAGSACYQPPPSVHSHMLSCFACSLLVPWTEHTSDTRWEGGSHSRDLDKPNPKGSI